MSLEKPDLRDSVLHELNMGDFKPRFIAGESDNRRIGIKYFKRKTDNKLVAKVWFGIGSEGPPDYAHGGSMAAVLDEVLGTVGWINNYPILVAKLTLEFKNLLPINNEMYAEAQIDKIDGKKVYSSGRIVDSKGKVFATGEALLITLPREKVLEIKKHMSLPEGCEID